VGFNRHEHAWLQQMEVIKCYRSPKTTVYDTNPTLTATQTQILTILSTYWLIMRLIHYKTAQEPKHDDEPAFVHK